MSHALSANPPPHPTRAAYQDCLAALLHPSIATYTMLGQQRASIWHAYILVFASSLIGGAIESLAPLESQLVAQRSLDVLLLALIPVTALIAVCSLAAFAWCAQKVARSFKGAGAYAQLAYVLATISAPLLIAASILDQIPAIRIVLVVVYLYWLAQYVVAIRAVSGLSRVRAIAVLFITLLLLGVVWLGVAFLVGYSGILLP
jgi:Yip1 domain